jgi:hypothetical protein
MLVSRAGAALRKTGVSYLVLGCRHRICNSKIAFEAVLHYAWRRGYTLHQGGIMFRAWVLTLLMAVLFLAPPELFSQFDPDPGIPDTFRIGCPTYIPAIVPGDSFRIPVYIWNDYPIAGLGIGITYDYDNVVIESFDTTGTVLDSEQAAAFYDAYIPGEKHAYIGWIPFDPDLNFEPTGDDTAAFWFALNMKVLPGAAPATILLDTAFAEPGRYVTMSVDTSSTSSIWYISITPQFTHCPAGDIYLGLAQCGDVDGNGIVNVSDAVYLISYIFGGGPPPDPLLTGDVDCNGIVNISDAVYMITYIFGGGPEPCDPSGDGIPDC